MSHRDGTFRILAKRQTGNAESGRFFLNAAGIRQNQP
jgi:hypothetical protein